MVEELKSIREQLFDAPVEVKQAFNDVVNYFSNENGVTLKLEGNLSKTRSDRQGRYSWVNLDYDKTEYKVGEKVKRYGNTYLVIAKESNAEFRKKVDSGEYKMHE